MVAERGTELSDHVARLRDWLLSNRLALEPFHTRVSGSIADAVEHDRLLMRLLYDAGWSRWGWPEEVGGLGGTALRRAALYDELAAADVEIPEAFVILETLGPVLCEFAPALGAQHLPAYLRGDELWGQGFSEPDAGSDLAQMRTRAVRGDDGYVLNGQKVWTTLGQFARHAAVLARTGPSGSAHRGLTMLWVDLAVAGATTRPIRASSERDEFAEMYFDDVLVPGDRLIGSEGQGWAVAMYLLQFERGMYAWLRQAVLHRRLRQLAERMSTEDRAHLSAGAVLALAEALGLVSRLRALSRRTVFRLAEGENPGSEISSDKITLARAEQATYDAIRQCKWNDFGFGEADADQVLREEWFYSRAASIFGGAIEVQRDIIADRVLALPRECER